jgi:nucleoside-diphosphate-sugar epimerase
MKTILVLGVTGNVGRAVATEAIAKGWRVLGLIRRVEVDLPKGVIPIRAPLSDPKAVAMACGQVDVVFNGLNLPYPDWPAKALDFFKSSGEVIARLNDGRGVRQIFPGNVYNFGTKMPKALIPETPMRAKTQKGRIRIEIETYWEAEAKAGRFRTLILRAGDFFGPATGKDWMNALIAKDVAKGSLTGAGSMDVLHAYAYLPDLAEAIVRLAKIEATLPAFVSYHFEGHNVTLKTLAQAFEVNYGKRIKVSKMPRFIFYVLGVFDPFMKAVQEMLYLFDVPHALYDDRLPKLIGPLPRTPLSEAVTDIWLGSKARHK